jgi:uncharacterized protein (DUF2237 family)
MTYTVLFWYGVKPNQKVCLLSMRFQNKITYNLAGRVVLNKSHIRIGVGAMLNLFTFSKTHKWCKYFFLNKEKK